MRRVWQIYQERCSFSLSRTVTAKYPIYWIDLGQEPFSAKELGWVSGICAFHLTSCSHLRLWVWLLVFWSGWFIVFGMVSGCFDLLWSRVWSILSFLRLGPGRSDLTCSRSTFTQAIVIRLWRSALSGLVEWLYTVTLSYCGVLPLLHQAITYSQVHDQTF